MSEAFQLLAKALYRERVPRARRTPPQERILDDPRLFAYAGSVTMAGLVDHCSRHARQTR